MLWLRGTGFSRWWCLCCGAWALRPAGSSSGSTGAQQLHLPGSRAWAQQVWHLGFVAHGVWGLLRSGAECVRPALAGGVSTTEPPGTPMLHVFCWIYPNAARVLLDLSQVLLFGM